MAESEWHLLTTFPDQPSAQALAEVLRGAGMAVRVSSDAGVLGQAAPTRLYVGTADLRAAQLFLSQHEFSDEELGALALDAPPSEPP